MHHIHIGIDGANPYGALDKARFYAEHNGLTIVGVKLAQALQTRITRTQVRALLAVDGTVTVSYSPKLNYNPHDDFGSLRLAHGYIVGECNGERKLDTASAFVLVYAINMLHSLVILGDYPQSTKISDTIIVTSSL